MQMFEDTNPNDDYLDGQYWELQTRDNSCSIAGIRSVIEKYWHVNVPEADLIQYAYEKGWWQPDETRNPNGLDPDHIPDMLRGFGIPAYVHKNMSFGDLLERLNRNEEVLVWVDGKEIPRRDEYYQFAWEKKADSPHLVSVLCHTRDPRTGEIVLLVNDFGEEDGAALHVRESNFLNAWEDYGNYAVVTQLHQYDEPSVLSHPSPIFHPFVTQLKGTFQPSEEVQNRFFRK